MRAEVLVGTEELGPVLCDLDQSLWSGKIVKYLYRSEQNRHEVLPRWVPREAGERLEYLGKVGPYTAPIRKTWNERRKEPILEGPCRGGWEKAPQWPTRPIAEDQKEWHEDMMPFFPQCLLSTHPRETLTKPHGKRRELPNDKRLAFLPLVRGGRLILEVQSSFRKIKPFLFLCTPKYIYCNSHSRHIFNILYWGNFLERGRCIQLNTKCIGFFIINYDFCFDIIYWVSVKYMDRT